MLGSLKKKAEEVPIPVHSQVQKRKHQMEI